MGDFLSTYGGALGVVFTVIAAIAAWVYGRSRGLQGLEKHAQEIQNRLSRTIKEQNSLNESTIKSLRDAVASLQHTNSELEHRITTLYDEKSELRLKILELQHQLGNQ